MAIFEKAEIRQGSNVIRVNVEVEANVPITGQSAGVVQWSGVLRPPNNTGMVRGDVYALVLPGYSSAKIQITQEPNPVDGTVVFKGIGEPPVSKRSVTK